MERLDIIFKGSVATVGGLVGYLWGGWTPLLQVLLTFVIADYITGLLASGVEGKLSSRIGFKSIPKKIAIFIMVAVAHLIDSAIGNGHMFRDATIFFYLSNELLSIIENAGRIGLPVPETLKQAVNVLKGKTNKGGK